MRGSGRMRRPWSPEDGSGGAEGIRQRPASTTTAPQQQPVVIPDHLQRQRNEVSAVRLVSRSAACWARKQSVRSDLLGLFVPLAFCRRVVLPGVRGLKNLHGFDKT